MRRIFLILFLLCGISLAHSQMVDVREFQGVDIATKLANAQLFGCNADTTVRCVLYIRPEMSVFARNIAGTPSPAALLCSRCTLLDYSKPGGGVTISGSMAGVISVSPIGPHAAAITAALAFVTANQGGIVTDLDCAQAASPAGSNTVFLENVVVIQTATLVLGPCVYQYTGSNSASPVQLQGASANLFGVSTAGPNGVLQPAGQTVIQDVTATSTKPVVSVVVGSGTQNGSVQNIALDCNGLAAVGLGFANAGQNWGVVQNVAAANCTTAGFQMTTAGAGSLRFDKISTSNVPIAFDSEVKTNDIKISFSRLLFTAHGVIIGTDDVVAGNTTSGFTLIANDISNTGINPVEHVLVRNAIDTVIEGNNRFETNASSNTIAAQVVLGTATPSTPNGVAIFGNYFAGNAKANFGINFVSVINPWVMGNVGDNLTTRLVTNNTTTSAGVVAFNRSAGSAGAAFDSATGLIFGFGDTTLANPQLKTPMGFIGASGTNGYFVEQTGDTGVRLGMSNNGQMNFGSGTGATDAALTRIAAGELQVQGAPQQLDFARTKAVGTAPTCTFTSGGGTTPSCTVDTGSTDGVGIIIATTGTGAPAAAGTITLTFSSNYGTNKPVCDYGASLNGAGQWNARASVQDKTPAIGSDLSQWDNNAVALSVSTAYWINYQCSGK